MLVEPAPERLIEEPKKSNYFYSWLKKLLTVIIRNKIIRHYN